MGIVIVFLGWEIYGIATGEYESRVSFAATY
jgi:hypothetical protein